jgi:hypothetical protein
MVEGIPAYDPRFGFEQASTLGFISPHPKIPDDAFMVKRLPGYSPDLGGRIVYPAEFDDLGYCASAFFLCPSGSIAPAIAASFPVGTSSDTVIPLRRRIRGC